MGFLLSTLYGRNQPITEDAGADMVQRKLKQVTSISDSELEEYVRLAGTAFGDDDASMLALLGGDISLRDELLAAMFRAVLLEGKVYVVECNSQVVSVALWFRQPIGLFKTDAQRALGYDEWFKKLPKELQHWWTVDYPEQLKGYAKKIISQEHLHHSREAAYKELVKKDCCTLNKASVHSRGPSEWDKMWFCNLMVTDLKQQGRGHATFLMNQLTAKARASGEILGLSTGTEINVPKYESMGFRERGRIILHSLINEVPCVWMTKA
ncbi:hypothetical protein PENSPDRAFT_732316 [Peniophora sp. CONT]|nr:hypothetical protein PENSPDRAFT_732316 [Peniophora sp. CONT]